MAGEQLPIEAESIRDLNKIAGILAPIFGIILIVIGIPLLLILIGIVFIIFGVIDILIWNNLKEINHLI